MKIEVKVPVLPESITEATLVNWHKKAGDAVARDENLVDIETDKVVLEFPAPDSGVLTEIRRGDGSTVVAQEVKSLAEQSKQATAQVRTILNDIQLATSAAVMASAAAAGIAFALKASARPSPTNTMPIFSIVL